MFDRRAHTLPFLFVIDLSQYAASDNGAEKPLLVLGSGFHRVQATAMIKFDDGQHTARAGFARSAIFASVLVFLFLC